MSPSSGTKTVSILRRLHGEVELSFKNVTDKDKRNKNKNKQNFFTRLAAYDVRAPPNGKVIEVIHTILTAGKSVRTRGTVLPLGMLKTWGKLNAPRNLNPYNS